MTRATPKDLGLALLVGFLIAEGPLTPAAMGPSIAAGALCGGAFLVWRVRRAPRAASAAAAAWQVPGRVWLALGAFTLAFSPTLVWMYGQWTGSVWHNTHGMIIPVLMLLLGRNILRRLPPKPTEEQPSPWGFAFLIPGLCLLALDAAPATHYVAAVGFVLCLPGLSLLLLGPRRTRALALPLTMGVFMIPLPNTFASHVYLRTITTQAVGSILNAVGIPTLAEHTVLELPTSSFLVADACSGFSTLYSTVAMAVLLGTLCSSIRRRWVIYLSIVPLALAANVVRVLALVFLFLNVDPALLDSSAHAASGVAAFFAVLGVLIFLADRPSLARALL